MYAAVTYINVAECVLLASIKLPFSNIINNTFLQKIIKEKASS